MPKLPTASGAELIKALQRAGFRIVRQKGSHVSMQKTTSDKNYNTVVPLHRELAKGALIDILHQCGLSKDELIESLK